MHILVTNDDGIYAPGLEALAVELTRLGTVEVFAPAIEQSGVSHSITYLTPLIVQDVFRDGKLFGRKVAGSPADCVKLAMLQLSNTLPSLVVSGVNAGANVGINVLYSGTVAAAIEGAFFGVTSIAVSLAMTEQPDFRRAAKLAVDLIAQLMSQDVPAGSLWNINLPESRSDWPLGVRAVPMCVERYREVLERRTDPRGRTYYWAGMEPKTPHSGDPDTDVRALAEGYATITPLHFALTHRERLEAAREWTFRL